MSSPETPIPSASRICNAIPPHARNMRIGLLGGTFNPAHDGHRHISREALKRLALDRIWWLVTPGNPLKDNVELPKIETRAAHAAAIADHPRIDVTLLEQRLGTSYTADTLDRLTRRSPGVRFVWLMGGDNLAGFHQWDRWQDIAGLMPFAVLDRPGTRTKALAGRAARTLTASRVRPVEARRLAEMTPPAWTFLDIPLSDLSSTDLRATT
ncbi:MAG: nicotinate-nucleotide adenylyltransferase [Pseudomonadota bacterium]